jgi:hypothetical protein
LEEQKEKQNNINDTNGPAPDIRFGRKPYCDGAGEGTKKFKVADRTAQGIEENTVAVEELH